MDEYKKLIEDSKEYLKTRYDLLRLELLDKLSQIVGILILVIVALLLIMGALAYFSVALVHFLSTFMSTSVACIILGSIILLVALILYLLREKVFINPLVKLFSGMLFADPNEEKGEEVQNETTA